MDIWAPKRGIVIPHEAENHPYNKQPFYGLPGMVESRLIRIIKPDLWKANRLLPIVTKQLPTKAP
jgi:hypothetical protein